MDFFSSMKMTINNEKPKITNSKKSLILISCITKTTWRKCLHTNISKLIFSTNLTKTIALRKGLMEGGNLIMGLKIVENYQPLNLG